MRARTQTTRTNHLGYDVGSSRKIPDGERRARLNPPAASRPDRHVWLWRPI
jgi:hypothetical protein